MASSSNASASASAPAPQQPTLVQDDEIDWLSKINPRFADLANVSIVLNDRVTKYEFKDDELMNRPGISLDRHTDHEIAKLGQKVIPMVSSGFTRQGAAAIFVLAYHLRSPPGTDYSDYVFTDGHKYATTGDTKYTDHEDVLMTFQAQGSARPIPSPISDSVKGDAAMYSYIAASMLRLFTKPAATYMRAWNRIIEGFAKSYRKSVSQYTRVLPTPEEGSLKSLANWFTSWEPKAKVTLFRLLHMSNSNKDHIGMKDFLYDMHLSYTGMHIVPMLFQLCELLNCSPDVVLAAIECRGTQPEVTCLKHILELRADGDGGGEKHKRKMWRYGRLFDVGFMADLQTKACPKLVYTFGEAMKSEAPEAHGGILNIAQLAHIGEYYKERCAAAAQALLKILKESR